MYWIGNKNPQVIIITLIRKVKLADLNSIFSLNEKIFIHHSKNKNFPKMKKNAAKISRKYLKRQIHNKNAQIFIVESDEKPIGFAMFTIVKFPPIFIIEKEVRLAAIFVEKKYRKKGIAQKLIKEGRKWGKTKGLNHMNLGVSARNKQALAAYKKAGFKIRRYLMKNY